MKCYNLSCKEECDNIKKMYCIFKITERQRELAIKVNRNNCSKCGAKTVPARYKKKVARLCTSCGRVLQDRAVAEVCWIDSRRAI